MASAHAVKTSVTNNSRSQDSSHPDDHFQSKLTWIFGHMRQTSLLILQRKLEKGHIWTHDQKHLIKGYISNVGCVAVIIKDLSSLMVSCSAKKFPIYSF